MATRNENILTLGRLSALLLLLVLVLANVVFARNPTRIDLTEEGIHTLSAGSENVLASLADPGLIKVFWHGIPEDAEAQRLDIAALLDEMRVASKGKLRVRWVDLDDEDGQQEAQDDGVQKYTFTAQREGEVRAMEGYAALVIEVGDKQEQIPQLVGLGERLEYELITRLYRMTTRDETVVGLVVERPASNPFMGAAGGGQGRFRNLEALLGQELQASMRTTISLDDPVPPDVDLLIVLAPEAWDETRAYHLEQYVLRGGRVLLFLDPMHAGPMEAPGGQATRSGLEDWLAHLGIQVESGVVGDFQNYVLRARQRDGGRGGEAVKYPYWLLLRQPFMDQENPATRGFDQVPLYWPAPLSLSPEAIAAGTLIPLASTTENGIVRPDLFGLDRATWESEKPASIEELSSIPLVALRKGAMTSYWQGKPMPRPKKDEEGDAAPDETPDGVEEPEDTGPERLDEGEGLLVVFTDAELVGDDLLWHAQRLGNVYSGGFSLALNITEWMTGSDDLLALRAKARNDRLIEDVEPKDQKLYTWLNMLGVPLLFLFLGIVVFIVRRVQR